MLDRRLRLILAGLLIFVALGASLWVSPPQTPISVDKLMSSPSEHEDMVVVLRGTVSNGSLDMQSYSFNLDGENLTVPVNFAAIAVPNGMSEGKTIIVEGTFSKLNDIWGLSAEKITVGCPSKYNAG
ncbi:MAG: cytochrome c maturation protein CcmE [Candidatus Thermoplasmatota archaeon]|nr:cytochrome c maturation protein CcmE [Candidatus Thermoplasmatota archaeon]MEE3134447.1 cytochrome c maturation protein CcmE [Candidatus Thermoplasmatota archaeon]|tara:strand:- start:400 stop:780 length:381 start_codon:yes stop_codon:yes gene_type:complete